jgi:cytoskeletal protein CcmA (bactofilin family)
MNRKLFSTINSRPIPTTLLITATLFSCLCLWSIAFDTLAEEDKKGVVISESTNIYLSGSSVRPSGPVEGDLFAAGGNVNVDQPVKGDASLAGGQVTVNGPISDDLRAAGGQIILNGKVGGEVLFAGGKINVDSNADVQGRLRAAGGNITLAGKYAKGLKAYGGSITLAGEVNGDVHLGGGSIEILPSAKINGDLHYTSREELKINPAQVSGTVRRTAESKNWRQDNHMKERSWASRNGLYFSPFLLLGLIAAAAVFILLFPNATRGAQLEVGASPWTSLGLGAAMLFTLPPIVFLLMVTVIGIPLAFTLLALYPLLLLIGYLTTALYIGDCGATALKKNTISSNWMRIGFVALALLALALIRLIPFVGSLLVFAALLIGMGAWSLHLYHRYKA